MDIATNLASQVRDRGEDAARQEVALNLRKPQFHLVEPRRVRRREVQPHVRMFEQEGAHGLGLVGREIIRDDVNLAPLRLSGDDISQEGDVSPGNDGNLK